MQDKNVHCVGIILHEIANLFSKTYNRMKEDDSGISNTLMVNSTCPSILDYMQNTGAALGFKIHGAKATKWPKPDQKFGSYLAQGLKISKIHGAIAPLALP